MAELKTKVNDASISEFLDSLEDESKRNDTQTIMALMQKTAKTEPKMWGSSIIGFGTYHYYYASGREGDWFIIGVSPRKQNITLYVEGGWEHNAGLLAKLGKHSLGKGCLYIKRLSDANLLVLEELIESSYQHAEELSQEIARKHAQQKS
jgi:hypothetical protein